MSKFHTSFVDFTGHKIEIDLFEDGWVTIDDTGREDCVIYIAPHSIDKFIAAVKELEANLTNNQK